jgi:hypothetical protein
MADTSTSVLCVTCRQRVELASEALARKEKRLVEKATGQQE